MYAFIYSGITATNILIRVLSIQFFEILLIVVLELEPQSEVFLL